MNDFDIQEFVGNRERLMPLLLIGDEQQCMVKQYINDGRVFVAYCEMTLWRWLWCRSLRNACAK